MTSDFQLRVQHVHPHKSFWLMIHKMYMRTPAKAGSSVRIQQQSTAVFSHVRRPDFIAFHINLAEQWDKQMLICLISSLQCVIFSISLPKWPLFQLPLWLTFPFRNLLKSSVELLYCSVTFLLFCLFLKQTFLICTRKSVFKHEINKRINKPSIWLTVFQYGVSFWNYRGF